ncbi:hypothetical protein F4802DRAFT_552634 [Xylaria palmicola]|nr:hypothetical protein F4802DRAFT_552634 [Xylaria palmicola]
MGHRLSLRDLVGEVIAAIQEVDEHVLASDYIKCDVLDLVPGTEANGYNYTDPEAHFEDFGDIRYWEKYFEFVLREWNQGQHGRRMNESQFNFVIERLTTAASRLDHFGPQLAAMYQGIPKFPQRRIHGIVRRRTVLNSFMNSAEIGLEQHYSSADSSTTRTLRQRWPIPRAGRAEPLREENDASSNTSRPEAEGIASRNVPERLISAATTNGALISLTTLATIVSGIIQAYGYSIETSNEAMGQSAEFFNTLQSALMQLLSLYVTMLPAVRHRSVQSSYQKWSWVLAGLGFTSPFLAIGVSPNNPAVGQLVLFLGSAVQSTIILQLIWAMDHMVAMASNRRDE